MTGRATAQNPLLCAGQAGLNLLVDVVGADLPKLCLPRLDACRSRLYFVLTKEVVTRQRALQMLVVVLRDIAGRELTKEAAQFEGLVGGVVHLDGEDDPKLLPAVG